MSDQRSHHFVGPYAPDRTTVVTRVPTHGRLSDQQVVVATLLGIGRSYRQIADELKITVLTVKYHVETAASRIPGDLSAKMKVVAWVRGATLDVLEGRSLAFEVLQRARGRSPLLEVVEAAATA